MEGWFLHLVLLPLGMGEAKVCIALVSGGLDSPVAVARALKNGWTIYPVHCSQEPVVGPEAEAKTIAALRHLLESDGPIGEAARAQIHPTLIVIPVAKQLALFTEKWAHTEYFIHMKRMYHRLAEVAGLDVGATHLLTGENLGQVSSQTLGTLGSIEQASNLVPLRPLLGFDKNTIIRMARVLGTYDLSLGPEVCDALGPTTPVTIANQEWIEKSEVRVGGLQDLCLDAWAQHRRVEL